MQQIITKFSKELDLSLCEEQISSLIKYAELVWEKKNFLNLTSVADLKEIITRHICDGMVSAKVVDEMSKQHSEEILSMADFGSGAGYIGITNAICLPNVQVTLVESLEKRCSFLNWVIFSLKLKNVKVKNIRLGQKQIDLFDVATERAMGQLEDILPICLSAIKNSGIFIAYQGENTSATSIDLEKLKVKLEAIKTYSLPNDTRKRNLAIIKK